MLGLFVYALETKQLRRLTDDPFADLDPEWTPDGKELVWVTDRFSSNLETLTFGNYRIAAMTPGSTQVRELAGFTEGRNSNPEFGPDGSLFFLATPDGIANIYRLQNPSRGGTPTRITNVVSGVAGITPLTPALSAASRDHAFGFTVFEQDDYNIYAGDEARPSTVGALATGTKNAAALPPANRRPGPVVQLLQNATVGLPRAIRARCRTMTEAPARSHQPADDRRRRRSLRRVWAAASRSRSPICSTTTCSVQRWSTNRIEETGGQAVC